MSEYTAEQVDAMAAELRAAPATSMWGTNISVRTDKAMAMYEALVAYAATLRQQGERGDGAVSEDVREAVCDAVATALGDAMDCTRVWSAWGVGTMSEDDFSVVADDSDRVAEIADAALEAVAPLLRAPAEQGGRVDEALDAQLLIANNDDARVWQILEAAGVTDPRAALQAALAQNAQGEAVGEVFGPKAVSTMVALDKPLPPGTKLYLHAERARVPEDWHDSIEMARDEFQRIHDMLLPECECDPCPECGRQPSECSGTDCAATCQCSTCDHCRVEDAMHRLDVMLDAAPSQPENASHE